MDNSSTTETKEKCEGIRMKSEKSSKAKKRSPLVGAGRNFRQKGGIIPGITVVEAILSLLLLAPVKHIVPNTPIPFSMARSLKVRGTVYRLVGLESS